ncbi:hypothetical protein [Pseudoneobacillus rhizosphaerae]|uniref:Uncharacterized protein n=1 Tax=Pseudoneobacillus rhizosphaerae TaxID=2880968 RepID=A0A9C7G9M9_9BACI|nr:hypothetical protein [Pseudoneobacillus rhizosphaerae]CAG9608469.1 hypothetical protein NEOCIP111885_02163 [Pseudoneobacillus rhizosphaerae]
MSIEERELFFSIMKDAYLRGITSNELSVETLVNEIKQKLMPILAKDIIGQGEV